MTSLIWLFIGVFAIIIFLIAYNYCGENRSTIPFEKTKKEFRRFTNTNHDKNNESHHDQQLSGPRDWKTETYCCKVASDIFGVEFKKIRPDFLKSTETNRNLELDCYNDEIKVAIEYNGIQHYVYPNIFHKDKKSFLRYIRNDDYKRRMCDLHGVYLITIPYTIKKDKIKSYILEQAKSLI